MTAAFDCEPLSTLSPHHRPLRPVTPIHCSAVPVSNTPLPRHNIHLHVQQHMLTTMLPPITLPSQPVPLTGRDQQI